MEGSGGAHTLEEARVCVGGVRESIEIEGFCVRGGGGDRME